MIKFKLETYSMKSFRTLVSGIFQAKNMAFSQILFEFWPMNKFKLETPRFAFFSVVFKCFYS